MLSNSLKHKTVLFLEDNKSFAEHTIKFLKLYVNEILHCTSIKEALKLFEEKQVDFVISDLKVDDGIALSFIENIRTLNKRIPIVVLSAHKDEKFLLKSIPLGLTAYLIKPVGFEQFKEILEKCANALSLEDTNIVSVKKDILYDYNKKILLNNGEEITLTQREVQFVELLLQNKNRIIKKEDISEVIWNDNTMSESALKNFLLRVRKKVGKDFFYTIQNVGYRL